MSKFFGLGSDAPKKLTDQLRLPRIPDIYHLTNLIVVRMHFFPFLKTVSSLGIAPSIYIDSLVGSVLLLLGWLSLDALCQSNNSNLGKAVD